MSTEAPRASMAERGIAKMMANLYQTISSPLTHQVLFDWYQFLMGNSHHLEHIGQYRKHEEAIQIVSGPDYDRKIHCEAPPSTCVLDEMDQFIGWFERSAFTGSAPLPRLTRSGIAHLWFEIHLFEDGNGRIGRFANIALAAQQSTYLYIDFYY